MPVTDTDAADEDAADKDSDARGAALEFTQSMIPFWEARLGPRLLGFYLLGSLAHGGFSRRYSDIDVALIAEDGLGDDVLEEMRAAAKALSADLAPKLSVFWTDRQFSMGRFPPLDRVDYCDRGVVLVERERVLPARPTVADIRLYLRGAPFARWAKNVERFKALDRLGADDHKPYLRAMLYPARFVYSWNTGRMGSNDDAVAFLHQNRPAGLDVDLAARALQCRHDAADPDHLFAERNLLPRQVDACAGLIAGPVPD
jgi:predicted nucleotidyltransferase